VRRSLLVIGRPRPGLYSDFLKSIRKRPGLDARGAKVVISQHPRRAKPLAIDEEMYKWRHLIENFFGKLKEFKRIALRADKTDQSFAAMIHIVAAVINSR
jgi:transposase